MIVNASPCSNSQCTKTKDKRAHGRKNANVVGRRAMSSANCLDSYIHSSHPIWWDLECRQLGCCFHFETENAFRSLALGPFSFLFTQFCGLVYLEGGAEGVATS